MPDRLLHLEIPDYGPLRVLVATDDALVRNALPALLREAGALVDEAVAGEPDVVVLDVADAGAADGVPALALVRDGAAAEAAWAAGARGLLLRDAAPPDLLAALVATARGLVVLDAALADDLLPAPPPPAPEADALTPREREVLALLAEGLPNKLVADRLGITERTARYHVAQILSRLGAQSRTEAVVRALQLGLLHL